MTLDLSDGGKHVRTRDGREVKIFMTQAGMPQPILGAIRARTQEEYWDFNRWCKDGRNISVAEGGIDLVPYTPAVTWQLEVPEGVTPICFVPDGNDPQVFGGYQYLSSHDGTVRYVNKGYALGSDHIILTPVTPVKVER